MGSRNLRPRAEAQPTGRPVSRERRGDWAGPMAPWAPLHPPRRATWPNGEWGYITRCHWLGPERQEAVSPDRALCLPTLSHFLIVNKTSLCLSPSLLEEVLFESQDILMRNDSHQIVRLEASNRFSHHLVPFSLQLGTGIHSAWSSARSNPF